MNLIDKDLEVKEGDLKKESELIANGIMIGVQANKYHTCIYNTERCDFNHSHLMLAARKGIDLGLKAHKENDMDKIEKIRVEVEGLRKHYLDREEYDLGWNKALDKVLSIFDTLEEEPVSDNLEQAAITAADEDMQGRQIMEESNEKRQLYSRIFRRGFKAGAKWQKAKDQETIELAEDHAMLAGMEKMKEQMIANAMDGRLYSTICGSEQSIVVPAGYGEYGKDGDKVKVIVLKNE